MGDAGRWWPRLSVAAVLAVLAVAAIAGLSQPQGVSLAARTTTVAAPPAPPAVSSPAPGAILAPIAARRTVASRGDVAYALLGGALTLADIPTRALVAYQRAASAIDLADDECHLDWQLLAALGKVLTDHGRTHGSVLDDEGVPRPWLVGPRLTGRHGTHRVSDTDGGTLDRDRHVDRAVGPMLLLPSVWSLVSVDGDADGRRNPQDIDDAALGAAVFLCAGPGDLSHAAQRREEIRRFHSGSDYTRSVLAVRAAYLDAGLPGTLSILVRAGGMSAVSPPVEASVPTPGDPASAGHDTFVHGPSATASPNGTHPTPVVSSASASGGPTSSGASSPSESPAQSPSQTPSGSQEPSDGPSPTATPSDCPSASDGLSDGPSESASPTATPDACPTPSPAEPTPTGDPTVGDDSRRTAALAAPGATLAPLAGLLWWRRRRAPDGEARSTV